MHWCVLKGNAYIQAVIVNWSRYVGTDCFLRTTGGFSSELQLALICSRLSFSATEWWCCVYDARSVKTRALHCTGHATAVNFVVLPLPKFVVGTQLAWIKSTDKFGPRYFMLNNIIKKIKSWQNAAIGVQQYFNWWQMENCWEHKDCYVGHWNTQWFLIFLRKQMYL